MRTSPLGLRVRCAVLVATPFIAVWVTPLIEGTRPVAKRAWLPWANILFVVVALYLLFAPLLVRVLIRRSREALEARGINQERLLLLMGVGGTGAVSMLALVPVAFFGGSTQFAYVWAAVSFLWGVFWCWRFRHVLV